MLSIPILTPAQASAWDRSAESAGILPATLMQTAGRAIVAVLAARMGDRLRQGVLVACGGGNNGGDGWVAARALHRLGLPVWVAALPAPEGSLSAAAARQARADGVREVAPDGPWPAVGLLVDAILGTGAKGRPREPAAALIERLADLPLPVAAVDGPSGLDLGDGVQHGPLRAALSITFGGYRRGHLLARDDVGDVIVVDIGFPWPDPAWPTLFTDAEAAAALPPLTAHMHKGERGRIVIVGGDQGMTGAARIAARAAFAAGAGLVHVIAPPGSIAALAQAEPDVQTRPQAFDSPVMPATRTLLEKADALVLGPGLGRHPSRRALLRAMLEATKPTVLDADALVAFAGAHAELREALAGRPAVLTPHLGEFRALFPEWAAEASVDPWGAAARAATAVGAAVLLKGVPTVIAMPGAPPRTVAAGNPGLATGGSGDTLSGVIGTFLAQGVETGIAAALGAQVLGRAADLAAMRHSARAVRPMDVVAAIPELWRAWAVARRSPAAVQPPILHELEGPRRD